MGDYLGGYFASKYFDSEIYDILIEVPEVAGYLASEWTAFKNNKKNKVPKDAKMPKNWAKKKIFDALQLRILTEALILGKYNVILDEDGHVTKDTPRPIKERKKIDLRGFYELLQSLRDSGKLAVLGEDVQKEYEIPKYFQDKIKEKYGYEFKQRQPLKIGADDLTEFYKEEANLKMKTLPVTTTPLEQKAIEEKSKVDTPQEEETKKEEVSEEETKKEDDIVLTDNDRKNLEKVMVNMREISKQVRLSIDRLSTMMDVLDKNAMYLEKRLESQ